jgi:Putative bacterial sensory transduction regulator
MLKILMVVAATCAVSTAVRADDALPCEKGLICASDPMTLVTAMQEEGYRAKLDKDSGGDPMIESEASGYDFQVYFYDCKDAKDCKAIQFNSGFITADDQTPAYANNWNKDKRFIKAFVNEKKELTLQYDMTTVGGLNKRNFADALDWWASMLGEFAKFVEQQKEKKD